MHTTKPRTKLRASQSSSRSKQNEKSSRNTISTDAYIMRQITQLQFSPYYLPSYMRYLFLALSSFIQIILQQLQQMATLKLARQLPFAYPFKSTLKSLLPVKTIIRNLGHTFYPRLVQIHQNVAQALVQNNIKYLKQAVTSQLEEELLQIKSHYKQLGCRLKINEPHRKLTLFKNYLLPESVFRTQQFYISVACKVYYGAKLNHTAPYGWLSNQKLLRFGKYRYIVYDKQLSLMQNIRLIFEDNMYEFIVKYQSSLYIKVNSLNSSTSLYQQSIVNKKYDQDIEQDLIQTQIVMRSSSDKFDWIIVDINQIMRKKYAK